MNTYGNVRSFDSNLDIYSNAYYIGEDLGSLICYITLNINTNFALTLIR